MRVRAAPGRRRVAGVLLLGALAVAARHRADAQPVELEALLSASEELGPRAAGVGGATAGLADDASATLSNPAGLATLPKGLDLAFGADYRFRPAASPDAPAVERWRVPSLLSVGLHPRRSLAFGFAWAVREHGDLGLPAGAAEDPAAPAALRLKIRDLAPALAFRLGPRYAIGAAANWTALSLESPASVSGGGASAPLSVSDFNLRVGFLMHPGAQFRAGLAYQSGGRWRLAPAPEALTIDLRTPETLSFGLSWRADFPNSTRLLIMSQSDLLLREGGGTAPGELPHEAGWRVGAELSFPFGCFTGCGSMWQLRAGLQSEPPSSLAAVPAGRATLDAVRHLNWTLGGSVAPGLGRGRFRLDLHTGEVRGRFTLHFGVAVRFPQPYRGDLRFRPPPASSEPAAAPAATPSRPEEP